MYMEHQEFSFQLKIILNKISNLEYKYEDISNLEWLIEEKLRFTRINTASSSRGAEMAAKIISEFL